MHMKEKHRNEEVRTYKQGEGKSKGEEAYKEGKDWGIYVGRGREEGS